ncbi:MAG: hypothetical protein IID13_05235 [Candidatus Marinimicrobia bacterium]|nr:hypothetical protein [Candidatus Neomarinimicrobiota bacterium]
MRRARVCRYGYVILLALPAMVPAQNFAYGSGDWQQLPALSEITSASTGDQGLYFSTLDGLLYFDYFTQTLSPLPELNFGLPERLIYQVYHDRSTLALWIVYQRGVAFRMPTDYYWREVSFSALPDNFDGRWVTHVGGNYDGIWIDSDGVFTQLNSFTGQFMRTTLVPPAPPMEWNVSRADFDFAPDLSGWFGTGEWIATIRDFVGPGGMLAVPTLSIPDQEQQVWFGTDLGLLFRGDRRVRQLELLQAGYTPRQVITMLLDGKRVWFADNAYRRTGKPNPLREGFFLTSWDEQAGRWRYYNGSESELIRDVGVNKMLRVGQRLWLATMEGIALLDTRRGTWGWIGSNDGLLDPAVWDLASHGDFVYAATTAGLAMIDPRTLKVVVDTLATLPRTQVLALLSDSTALYAGTISGLYEYGERVGNQWRRIFDLPVDGLWSSGEELFVVANNLVFQRSAHGRLFEPIALKAPNGGKILDIEGYGPYIWLATSAGAVVFDRRDQRRFTFTRKDGLPSEIIYALIPTSQWVWFLTSAGVVRFNWGAYFE